MPARRRTSIALLLFVALAAIAGVLVLVLGSSGSRGAGGHERAADGPSRADPLTASPADPPVLLGAPGPGPRGSGERGGATPPGLEDPYSLTVAVLDAEGRGLPGVQVVGIVRTEGASGSRDSELVAAIADPEGVALLTWPSRTLAIVRESRAEARYLVRAKVALPEPPERDLGLDPRGRVSVSLRLPPSAALDVALVDEGGSALEEPSEVYLFWREPGSGGAWRWNGTARATVAGGRASFSIAPAGLELLLRSTGTDGRFGSETTIGPLAPARDPVPVRLTLSLRPWIVLRASDPSGAPLANASLSVTFFLAPPGTRFGPGAADPRSARRSTTTQEDGRLRLALTIPPREGWQRVLYVERAATDPDVSESRQRLFLPLDDDLPEGGESDVGTHRLEAEPEITVLTGSVVDPGGAPLEGVAVTGEYRRSGEVVYLRRRPVLSDAAGAFVLRTTRPPRRGFTVRAFKLGYPALEEEARVNDTNVVLRLASP